MEQVELSVFVRVNSCYFVDRFFCGKKTDDPRINTNEDEDKRAVTVEALVVLIDKVVFTSTPLFSWTIFPHATSTRARTGPYNDRLQ